MSDILIRGMEMPTSCWDCPCSNEEYGYCQADKARRRLPYDNPFPAWCPAIPVSEHGRLVDADAAQKESDDYCREHYFSQMERVGLNILLSKMPTIIPASEEDQGETI